MQFDCQSRFCKSYNGSGKSAYWQIFIYLFNKDNTTGSASDVTAGYEDQTISVYQRERSFVKFLVINVGFEDVPHPQSSAKPNNNVFRNLVEGFPPELLGN